MILLLRHVFGKLTLQTATIVLSSLFITQAFCILIANAVFLDSETLAPWFVMFLCVFLLFIIWLMAFKGAYEESVGLITWSTVLWTIYLVLWAVVVCLSFVRTQDKNVCIRSRCPNSLWLLSDSSHEPRQRDYYEPLNFEFSAAAVKPRRKKTLKYKSSNIMAVDKSKKSHGREPHVRIGLNDTISEIWAKFSKHFALKDTVSADETENGQFDRSSSTNNPIVSIVVSIVYLSIALFSWIVLNSYRKEIEYAVIFTANNRNRII